jgi:hypothetical protein
LARCTGDEHGADHDVGGKHLFLDGVDGRKAGANAAGEQFIEFAKPGSERSRT